MTAQRPKTIFITGSSSGLGRAAAKLFASHEWKVIATMRNPEREAELATLPGVALFPLDITDRAQIEQAATRAVAAGGVDVVFNNAGYGMSGPLEGLTDEQMLRMVNTNLLGTIRTTKAFIPAFQRKENRTVHQYHLHWRVDHRAVQLPVPRYEMGARGLEREYGVRIEPA